MNTIDLTLEQIDTLAREVFDANGCDEANTEALTRTIVTAERDGSLSHGLFRVPGYVASLRSGKVNGAAEPRISRPTASHVQVDGDNGYAPLAIERGIPVLAEAAHEQGVAVMTAVRTHHFAALWPEVEALAERGLVGLACVCYKPFMAPFGGNRALFGTNPFAFAWPRPGKSPMVIDMATSAMALGEIQIAAREGHDVPPGTGLDARGRPTTDPAEIAKGILLPFGGHKGSALALMVELLAAGATGERFSYEAGEADSSDGGPPRGGEFFLALSPQRLAGEQWAEHCEAFFERFESIEGARLPGARRHANRGDPSPRAVNAELVDKIRALRR